MFKYGLILLLTIILFSCGETEDIRWEDENENIVDCDKVIGYTDSLIIFADKKIDKIRKRNKNQILVMDSLEHTIEVEQHIIDNLNKEVVRRIGVDETLELTIIKLEKSLLRCKSKEKKIEHIEEQFALKSEKFMDEKIYLMDFYNNKIDSLMKKIIVLEKDSVIIDLIEESTNKKPKKRRNKKRRNKKNGK